MSIAKEPCKRYTLSIAAGYCTCGWPSEKHPEAIREAKKFYDEMVARLNERRTIDVAKVPVTDKDTSAS